MDRGAKGFLGESDLKPFAELTGGSAEDVSCFLLLNIPAEKSPLLKIDKSRLRTL